MKERIRETAKRWMIFLVCLLFVAGAVYFKTKSLIRVHAQSSAKTIMINAANDAVLNVLRDNDISYDDISVVSVGKDNYITGIEINTVKINTLKSAVSKEISKILSRNEFYEISIPLGSLISDEYTVGLGPKIKFKMQLSATSVPDFKSSLTDAGINQVMHQILININISGNIIMLASSNAFNVSTTVIAAQTVIAGKVPESFTNVVEEPGDDVADEIFNYADIK